MIFASIIILLALKIPPDFPEFYAQLPKIQLWELQIGLRSVGLGAS